MNPGPSPQRPRPHRRWWWALLAGSAAALLLAGGWLGWHRSGSEPVHSEAQQTGLALVKARACLSCHGVVGRQVGPGFAQVAERYHGEAGATERLARHIREGSVGRWGRLVMPPQVRVSEAEALSLAEWILTQPPPPH